MARILVVEDEPYIALGLKSDLVLEGYEVEVARDGQAAGRCSWSRRVGPVLRRAAWT